MNKEQLILRLQAAGMPEEKIPAVISEVSAIIVGRMVAAGIERLSKEDQARAASMPKEELVQLIQAQREAIGMKSKDLVQIFEETWEEYFQALA